MTLDFRCHQKKNIDTSIQESSNISQPFGGGLNLSQNSPQGGSKPSVLTEKGQATYKPPVNPRQPKGLDVALEAYEQAQGIGSVDRIQEAIRSQPIGQIRDSSTDDGRFIKGTKNSFKNLATSLKGVIPRLDLVSTSTVEKILGRDNAISLGNFLRYNPFGADIGRDFATIQNEALDQLDYLSTQTLPTEGVLENVRNFNVGGLAAATVDAITSLAATAIPSVASGGTLLASEMIGGSLYDYNKAKADSKGIDIKKLYEKGEADFNVPAFLGSVAFGLEKIGLKGIENGIKGKLIGNGYKKALLLANDANKEGLTEFIQTGIDEANQVLGNGGSIEEASKSALDAMFSERGFEAYAKGALGGGLAVGAGRLSNNLINKKDRQQAQIIEDENQAILADIASDDIPSNAKTPLIDKLADNAEKLSEIINKEVTPLTELTEEGQALVSDIQSRIQATEEAIDNASEISKPILEEQVKELNKELHETIKDNKEVEVAPQEEIITEEIQTPTEIVETPIGNTQRINEINDTLNRNEVELSNPDLDPEMREFIEIQNEQLTEELNTLQEGQKEAILPVFERSFELLDSINKSEGGTKKRNLSKERRDLLAQYPSIKRIDDNISYIYKTLKDNNIIQTIGDCP